MPLIAAALQEIGKQETEAPTKAGEMTLLPLAQKMSKVIDRRISKQARKEPVEGLGATCGFVIAGIGPMR